MSVHIDEVEGRMEAEPASQQHGDSEGSSAAPADTNPHELRLELRRLAIRSARLQAD